MHNMKEETRMPDDHIEANNIEIEIKKIVDDIKKYDHITGSGKNKIIAELESVKQEFLKLDNELKDVLQKLHQKDRLLLRQQAEVIRLKEIENSLSWRSARRFLDFFDKKLFPIYTRRGQVLSKIVSKIVSERGDDRNPYKSIDVTSEDKTKENISAPSSSLDSIEKLRTRPDLIQPDKDGVYKLISNIRFDYHEQPLVSIVIPVYNRVEYTACCLSSIYKHCPDCRFEIIVIDDGSTDDTEEIISSISGILYIKNPQNQGYIKSINKGVRFVRGRYVLFLNNDIQVQHGWLDELVKVFDIVPEAGIVGSKLIYPSGHLQEAGAILNRDGTAELVGLNHDPSLPEYNIMREVDYCSGACILIDKVLFDKLGGFDESFIPAYYEDSDLAMRVRKLGRKVIYQPASIVVHHMSMSHKGVVFGKAKHIELNKRKFLNRWQTELDDLNRVRLIAFYLPQYHPIPENDLWWGKGFTEWTNVTKAKPNFEGHYQPRLPADLGFYDLRLPEVREASANLAREYGIYGFCYYYYWFNGKKLLNRPLDDVLQSENPKFPFCICWANENWTRQWDGRDSDILISQHYSKANDVKFIKDLIPVLQDNRYIKIKGKPLLLVYRLELLPNPKRTVKIWREECQKAGVGEIYLACAQSFNYIVDPAHFGFDAAVEFPPHGMNVPVEPPSAVTNPDFKGEIYDYLLTAENYINRELDSYKLYRTVMPAWDNTPRRQNDSHIFVNATPDHYAYWLKCMIEQTRKLKFGDERIVFINAWNEWGEGNYLEPDQRFGLQYLEATRDALSGDAKLIRLLKSNT